MRVKNRAATSAKTIARFGMLTAVALVLGYVEHLVPISPIPGIKLGLSNTVLLYAIYLMGAKSALALMVLKVLLSGLLFSGPTAMLYSFAGGVLSLAVMLLASIVPGLSIIGVSVCGAVAHNIGQCAVAALVVQIRAIFAYLPVLLLAAAAMGVVTGVVAKYVFRALRIYGALEDKAIKPQKRGRDAGEGLGPLKGKSDEE